MSRLQPHTHEADSSEKFCYAVLTAVQIISTIESRGRTISNYVAEIHPVRGGIKQANGAGGLRRVIFEEINYQASSSDFGLAHRERPQKTVDT